jgi:hypothetical protein
MLSKKIYELLKSNRKINRRMGVVGEEKDFIEVFLDARDENFIFSKIISKFKS